MSSLKCCNPLCQKNWILRCSACKSVGYCSTECQRSDWLHGHKTVCKTIVTENKKKQMEARIQLLKAVGNGDLKALKSYVETTETDVNWLAMDNVSGIEQTPLMMASRKGKLKLVQYLVGPRWIKQMIRA